MEPTKMTLKLLIDRSRNRVLFAEAGKDFVDFLFGLLQLPVGAILGLLAEHGTATNWSIAKVYESVQSMDSNYMQPNQSKISLLRPKFCPSNTKQTPMLEQFVCTDKDSSTTHLPAFSSAPAIGVSSPASSVSFSTTCGSSSPSFSSSSLLFGVANAPSSTPHGSSSSFLCSARSRVRARSRSRNRCLGLDPKVANRQEATIVADGYVRPMVTYMVMDDLTVKPMSTISSITLLNSFQVRDVGCAEEKITEIDSETASKLVKAAFESTTVLTDVFLIADVIFMWMID